MANAYERLLDLVTTKKAKAAVIGLGYVGLPLAHSMCAKGIHVTGFDTDPKKITAIHAGRTYLETVKAEHVAAHVKAGLLAATGDFAKLADADIVIICVPTPLGDHMEPDLSYIENTTRDIAATLREGQLVVLESTTYPGTLRDVMKPVLEATGLKSGSDFFLAFSPEREDPGNKNFETATIPKVVGGDGPQALGIASAFYASFIGKVVPVSSPETAEAVKITENIFRAVNIAMVNEMKMIYERMGIDIWEVIDAAKTKPFGFMPFYPGPGLGGHCIPIDPFYLTWKAREYGMPTRFIELAGEINLRMPDYVLDKTAAALNERKKSLNGSNILIMGIAYKKNVNDQRESPAFPLMRLLEQRGANVSFFDPHIPEITALRHFPEFVGRKSVSWDEKTIGAFDAAIIVTDHDAVNYARLGQWSKLIVDSRNAMKNHPEYSGKVVKA